MDHCHLRRHVAFYLDSWLAAGSTATALAASKLSYQLRGTVWGIWIGLRLLQVSGICVRVSQASLTRMQQSLERRALGIDIDEAYMKPISDKRRAALAEYQTVRFQYGLAHPFCEARVLCGGWGRDATDIHHIVGLAQGGARSDPENLMSVCRECHRWIHDHPDAARARGLMGRASRT